VTFASKLHRLLALLDWILTAQFGIDLRRLVRAIARLPRFGVELVRFRAKYSGNLGLLPCLHDWTEEGGSARGEYFWQDLYVARKIHLANPKRHVDIGSRVDGFVAHVASFREIEVFDIRHLAITIPGVVYKQCDLMNPVAGFDEYCDSLSCLHALEHFGLGRYGDPIDPKGHEAGLRNMARIVRRGGRFYLSVPLGIERVEFNGHRIFDPMTIVHLARACGLELDSFAAFSGENGIIEPSEVDEFFSRLRQERYRLGIFTFIRR